MLELNGNLWVERADVRIIPTNGDVNRNGEAVMGKGVAKQAAMRFPALPRRLGELLQKYGNHALLIGDDGHGAMLWSFPTKHKWFESADLDLIRRSAEQVVVMADRMEAYLERAPAILMPRPGCGNGGRIWTTEVKPIISHLLDDRFVVIHLAPRVVSK